MIDALQCKFSLLPEGANELRLALRGLQASPGEVSEQTRSLRHRASMPAKSRFVFMRSPRLYPSQNNVRGYEHDVA